MVTLAHKSLQTVPRILLQFQPEEVPGVVHPEEMAILVPDILLRSYPEGRERRDASFPLAIIHRKVINKNILKCQLFSISRIE